MDFVRDAKVTSRHLPFLDKERSMLLVTPIACLLLAWGEAPAIPVAPENHQDEREVPRYVVTQIKSGIEILVKRDGEQRRSDSSGSTRPGSPRRRRLMS